MPTLDMYQVDAFTAAPFGGNPAAVVPLDDWLPDDVLQGIALENNLSETAFWRPHNGAGADGDLDLRWFTPASEVDLCGHATLGASHVLLNRLETGRERVTFHTRSGPLTVSRGAEGRLVMDFPAQAPAPAEVGDVASVIGAEPELVVAGPYAVALLKDEAAVRAVSPDFGRFGELNPPFVIVTAPGEDCDFVSRFFAPTGGIDEDPVTGSAHCILTPFWAERFGKTEFHARQVSARGGEIWCRLEGDRVILEGHCVDYLEGRIQVPG